MDCARDLALLLIKVLFNIMHLSPLSIFIGGQAAELFKKVLLIIITLLYAAIALAIPLLLKYTFLVTYEDNMEYINMKDFNIFGSMNKDKTQISAINNQKHREIPKDKYKVLNINANTEIDMFKENLKNYIIAN